MRRVRALIVVAAGACTSPTPEPLGEHIAVVGKCTFAAERVQIEAGDVFLYVVTDVAQGGYSVLTGTATSSDPLDHREPRQPGGPLLTARLLDTSRLEFGNLDESGSGTADHFLGMRDRSGTIYIEIGTTYGTVHAYPLCSFW